MNKFKNYILLLYFIILSCKPPQIPTTTPIITQQATPCFGSCPVYTIDIYENGFVTLVSEKFLPLQGNYTAHLNRKETERLIRIFEQKIFSFKDQYTAPISDYPTIYLTFNYKGREKKIEDYYGAPQELKDLEAEVYSLIHKLKWKKAR